MWRWLGKLAHDVSGAVAPTVALSLFGLVAAGGIAFDYARLAAMDTELQQAADNAALAAATQLDRGEDSQDRATAAITGASASRLAANLTKFANDGGGQGVEIAAIVFCSEFDDSIADTMDACTIADEQSDSRFVMVTTQARTAEYALTPIVAAFSSGDITATAVAGVESSICNVAPLLVCAPSDDFPNAGDIGTGLLMKTAGGDDWAPGNYGLLDFGQGKPAVISALMGHGLNGCQNTDDNQTEPGNANVTDAINTRFDVYAGSPETKDPSACTMPDGSGCPAENVRKDMTTVMTYSIQRLTSLGEPTSIPNCGQAATSAPNANPKVTYDEWERNAAVNGFKRDACHDGGSCSRGNIGDGDWSTARDAYLAANHPGVTAGAIASELSAATGVTESATSLSRYDIYTWELRNPAARMGWKQIGATVMTSKSQGPNTTWTYKKVCAFAAPHFAGSGYDEQKDRRVLPIVAANCDNLKGKGEAFEDYTLLRAFDVFLTEPSLDRGDPQQAHEIYGEIIGPAQTFEAGTGFQYYSRNKPYLVR